MPNPICKFCNIPMGKSGKAFSGTKKIQRFRCSGCGRTTIVQQAVKPEEQGGSDKADPLSPITVD